jgi:hypothetical protein
MQANPIEAQYISGTSALSELKPPQVIDRTQSTSKRVNSEYIA